MSGNNPDFIWRIHFLPELKVELKARKAGTDTIIPIEWSNSDISQFFRCEPPEVIYHYTDLNGANGIINSKSLHLSKIQFVNDESELRHGIDHFRSAVENKVQTLTDIEKKEFLTRVSTQLEGFLNTNICIASFCEDGNLLSQWRGYGGQDGIALGFSRKALKQILQPGSIELQKCVYDADSKYALLLI